MEVLIGALVEVLIGALVVALLYQRYRLRVVQAALARACRLAKIAKAWDPRPPDEAFLKLLGECEQFVGKHGRVSVLNQRDQAGSYR